MSSIILKQMGWVTHCGKRYYVIDKQIDGIRKRSWSGHGEVAILAEEAHRRQKSEALARRILAKEIDFLARQLDALTKRMVLESMARAGFCYRYREWKRVSRMNKPPATVKSAGKSGGDRWLDSQSEAALIRESLKSKAVDLLNPGAFDSEDILAKIEVSREAMLSQQKTDAERLVAEQIAVFVLLDFVAYQRSMNIGSRDCYNEVESFWSRHHRFANFRLSRSLLYLVRLNNLGIGNGARVRK